MKNLKLMTVLILLSLASGKPAFSQGGAGGSVGNGGDAVLQYRSDGERYYIVKDLFDAKVHDPNDLLTDRQLKAFDDMSPEFRKLIHDLRPAMKELPFSTDHQDAILYILSRMDLATARHLAAPLALYTWEFSEKEQFVEDYSDPEDYRSEEHPEEDWAFRYGVHQAARRIGQTIYIANRVWNFMDKFNQVALIFHEMIYSLLKADTKLDYGQKPEDVRDSVAALFRLLLESETELFRFPNTVNFHELLTLGPGTGIRIDRETSTYELLLDGGGSVCYGFETLVTPKFETRYLAPKLRKH